MENFLDGIIVVLVVINIGMLFLNKVSINVNINYPKLESETYSNVAELQKQADEEFEKEQEKFIDTAKAVQDLFLDEEAK